MKICAASFQQAVIGDRVVRGYASLLPHGIQIYSTQTHNYTAGRQHSSKMWSVHIIFLYETTYFGNVTIFNNWDVTCFFYKGPYRGPIGHNIKILFGLTTLDLRRYILTKRVITLTFFENGLE